MSSFDDFLEFGKQKEVTKGQVWRVGWLLQYSNVTFGKKAPRKSLFKFLVSQSIAKICHYFKPPARNMLTVKSL